MCLWLLRRQASMFTAYLRGIETGRISYRPGILLGMMENSYISRPAATEIFHDCVSGPSLAFLILFGQYGKVLRKNPLVNVFICSLDIQRILYPSSLNTNEQIEFANDYNFNRAIFQLSG